MTKLFCVLLYLCITIGFASSCNLTPSKPVIAKTDGEVIENLYIKTTDTTPGITVNNLKNVVIKNCKIEHTSQKTSGSGITFSNTDGLNIENVTVELVGFTSGPLPSANNYNIYGYLSKNLVVKNVLVVGGSSGIELLECTDATVSNFVGVNMHGPFPRGQCLQTDNCKNVLIEDFYCKNDNSSWTEDNFNFWRSSNISLIRGLIDGNNSPSGVGVMFEQSDPESRNGLCQDVDTINMGDGCFSTYGGKNIVFRNSNCRNNHCSGWAGRGAPLSHGLMYNAGDESGITSVNIQLYSSSYYESCSKNIIYSSTKGSWTVVELTSRDFKPRQPITLQFCWE